VSVTVTVLCAKRNRAKVRRSLEERGYSIEEADGGFRIALESEAKAPDLMLYLQAKMYSENIKGRITVRRDSHQPVVLDRRLERQFGHQRHVANLSVQRHVGIYPADLVNRGSRGTNR
jgi:hypothetical protein